MATKVEDQVETRGDREVTVISVATVDRDGDGNVVKSEDGSTPKDDCYCGCGQEPQGRKARFSPGHDQRTLGRLVRAQQAGRGVIFTPHSEDEILAPIDAAKVIFTDKMVSKAQERLTAAPTPKKAAESDEGSEEG